MSSLPQLSRHLQQILTTVPTALARSSGFTQRRSKLTAAAFVQTVVGGFWAAPDASLSQLAQMATAAGVPISPQGLVQRFTPAAATLLDGVLAATRDIAVAAGPVPTELLARFTGVRVLDSTTVRLPAAYATEWPGCGGRVAHQGRAARKLTVQLDLLTGQLLGPEATPGRTQDRATALQAAPVPAGALRIADLGFWSLDRFRQIGADGAYWLSRHNVQVTVCTPAGTVKELSTWLATQAETVDTAVELGADAHLAARLLAIRVPPAVAAERRRKIRADARREGETPSRRKLALADWTVAVTNVPPARLSATEALTLLGARWQIELLFKLWKREGGLARSRSQHSVRIRCEQDAKLIGLILQHWLLITGSWALPERSLVRATPLVRTHVVLLVRALACPRHLLRMLQTLMHELSHAGHLSKRRHRPSTAQRLATPALGA